MQTVKRRLAPAKRRPAAAKRRRRVSRPKISGRRLLIAAVAAFLLISVGRSVLPALGIDTPKLPSFGGGGEDTPTAPVTKAPKAPTVDLNGVMVHGGGDPMVTLNPGLVRLGGS